MAEPSRRSVRWALLLGGMLLVIAAVVSVSLMRTMKDPVRPVAPISDPDFSFMVLGDFGTGGEDEIAVSTQMEAWVGDNGADALLTTGDNVYPEGDPAYFSRSWDEPYGWLEDTGLDVFASLGNHDYDFQGGAAVVDYFEMPGIWYRESFDQVDVFVLDANRVSDQAQTDWLKTELEASQAPWKIAVFHHPAYSCSLHGSTDEVIERWVPLFRSGEVDLVLTGHDHNYQRFESRDGTTYVVTGGGGAQLYGLEACEGEAPDHAAADDEHHHFLVLEGDEDRLRGRAISAEGEVLDDFALFAPDV